MADLETIVFAISIAAGTEAAILNGPTLVVNRSTFGSADGTWDLGSQTSTIGGFEVTQTTYAYQWDLSVRWRVRSSH